MKKIITLVLTISALAMNSQNIGINATGALPVASAMLDVVSTTRGLLIPRMTTAQKNAIAAPATSLLVFDTSLNAFYYFDGTIWVPLLSSTSGWMLTGNALTGTEFMGSTNAQPVRFFSNNAERARFLSTGEFVINNTGIVAGDQFSSYGAVTGVAGYGTAAAGTGVFGSSGTQAGGTGVWAFANQAGTAVALWATNTNATGASLLATGSNLTSWFSQGAGGSFNGLPIACAAYSGPSTITNGQGGGYFVGAMSAASVALQYSYVSYRSAGTWYKIIGTGAVSSVLRNQSTTDKVVFCPEATEVLLQDYGVGELKNGRAHITIDPVLSENIVVNEKHPLRVYVTLKGECNGVYVTNETKNGFDVIELGKGSSNVKFNYMLSANRADEIDERTGEIMSHTADIRLPDAPVQVPALSKETSKQSREQK